MVFSNGAILPASDEYDSVYERTQEISESVKLRIPVVWQNAHEIYYSAGSLRLWFGYVLANIFSEFSERVFVT